jgi:hypothetical protein
MGGFSIAARKRHDEFNMQRYTISANGCWIWSGPAPRGYGIMNVGFGRRQERKAHVVFWEAINGPVPDGMELDHLCRNTLCVNPSHCEAVTHRENIRRGAGTKLTESDVIRIRKLGASGVLQRVIAEEYHISSSHVCRILTGKKWVILDRDCPRRKK